MTGPLIERLPAVRGDYGEAVPMARHTWFGVGGPADIIFSLSLIHISEPTRPY